MEKRINYFEVKEMFNRITKGLKKVGRFIYG